MVKQHKGVGVGEVVGGALAGGVAVAGTGTGIVIHEVSNVLKKETGSGWLETAKKIGDDKPAQDALQEQAAKIAEQLEHEGKLMHGGHKAGIVLAGVAAMGLAAYGINAARNRNVPDKHIDAATAQVSQERVAGQNAAAKIVG